jgi:phosphate starvation-inducible PhoH-like protein
LEQALDYLTGVEGIAVARFTQSDVVRHALVTRIVAAYEAHENTGTKPRRSARAKPECE